MAIKLFARGISVCLARAIENQCYVLAAAQYGKHNEKRVSFGHALVSAVVSTLKCIGGQASMSFNLLWFKKQ